MTKDPNNEGMIFQVDGCSLREAVVSQLDECQICIMIL